MKIIVNSENHVVIIMFFPVRYKIRIKKNFLMCIGHCSVNGKQNIEGEDKGGDIFSIEQTKYLMSL